MEWISVEDKYPRIGDLILMSDGTTIWVDEARQPQDWYYEWTHWHPYQLPERPSR